MQNPHSLAQLYRPLIGRFVVAGDALIIARCCTIKPEIAVDVVDLGEASAVLET